MILMEMMLEVVIGVLVMEVDKVADVVTDMKVDKVTNMMAKITNEDFYDMTWFLWIWCLELVMAMVDKMVKITNEEFIDETNL